MQLFITPHQLPRDSPKRRPTRQTAPKRCQPSPSMPDQGLIVYFLEARERAGSPFPNPDLRETLGWLDVQYEQLKAELGLSEFKPALSL